MLLKLCNLVLFWCLLLFMLLMYLDYSPKWTGQGKKILIPFLSLTQKFSTFH